jgi:hypothetical protein
MLTKDSMRHTVKIMFTMLLIVITSIANGQIPETDDDTIRVSYQNSPELPDGIAIHMTLLLLDSLVKDDESRSAIWTSHGIDDTAKAARSRVFLLREQFFNLNKLPGRPTAIGIDLK